MCEFIGKPVHPDNDAINEILPVIKISLWKNYSTHLKRNKTVVFAGLKITEKRIRKFLAVQKRIDQILLLKFI